jgi:hypothetical protein
MNSRISILCHNTRRLKAGHQGVGEAGTFEATTRGVRLAGALGWG